MAESDIPARTSAAAERLRTTDDDAEVRRLCTELEPLLTEYWDVHPHSAMEMLEYVTLNLPVGLANPLVRSVVTAWRAKPGYDPDAGGSADHCYMSALILSENFDLVEQPWTERVLPGTLEKELRYQRFDRMRDGQRKKEIVLAIADSVGYG